MQSLVVFTCALAIASAGYITPIAPIEPLHTTYPGPQHLPVIGSNGVPIDTLAVQQATAEHLHHKVEAHVRNGDYVAPVVQAPLYPAAYPSYPSYPAYGYPSHPVISAAGVALETPEVAAAKVAHFSAHAKALTQTGHVIVKRGVVAAYPSATYPTVYDSYSPFSYAHHSAVVYRKRRGIVATPVAYSSYYSTPVSSYSSYPFANYY